MIVTKSDVSACIIDDDPIYVYGFKKLIKLRGLHSQITSFSNGSQAITWLKNPFNIPNLPDVIFLDVNMPGMDGWEFLQEFAEIKSQLGKKISIYMLSSSINLNDVYRAKNNVDVVDYIFKPISGHQLTELLGMMQETEETKIQKYKS
ncbi:Response regulator receiver domain-containing protein [Mucilaginibacter pineti]|uniref:Response regulator receiver domain-containing protein n=1 Tax=Mucilaginibacter pineti TaxID=1391627 RepID=A0A1G7J9I1_9SPHI|nr:response regulator [Mucilaginibacter pineti]SDF21555.1 Response regulator receiver domain-containing protein [Mucilaginibacter pineti]